MSLVVLGYQLSAPSGYGRKNLGETRTTSKNGNMRRRAGQSAAHPPPSGLIGDLEKESHLHSLAQLPVDHSWGGLKASNIQPRIKDSRNAFIAKVIFGKTRENARCTHRGRPKGSNRRSASCLHRERRSCSLYHSDILSLAFFIGYLLFPWHFLSETRLA